MTKLKKNLIYQTIYQVLAVLLPLLTTPIITRALGVDGLGRYAYISAIVNYFALFILLGVNSYGTREIAQAKENKDDKLAVNRTFLEIFYLQLLLALIIIVLYYMSISIWASNNDFLAKIQGIMLISTALDVSWYYFGIENFKKTITRDILIKLISVICIINFIKSDKDLYLYAIIIVLSTLCSNLYLFISLLKEIKCIHISIKKVTKHFKPNVILFVPVVAASIYVYIDKIMLGYISGSIQVGYYESIEKIINIPTACINALMMVMFPRISVLVQENGSYASDKVKQYIKVSIGGIGFFSFACFFGIIAVADVFVPVYMGDAFIAATATLQIGGLLVLPRGIRGLVKSECLLPSGKDKEVIVSIMSGAAVDLVLNILLMPQYGANGAILATVICEFFSCGVSLWYARSDVKILDVVKYLTPFVFPGSIMFIIIRIIKKYCLFNKVLQLVTMVLAGILVYGFICALIYYLYMKKKCCKKQKNT